MRDLIVGAIVVLPAFILYRRFSALNRWMYPETRIRSQTIATGVSLLVVLGIEFAVITLLWLVLYVFHMTLPAFVVIKLVG